MRERRHVSVVFVDLVSFTALAESRHDEEISELLERYFEMARTVIDRYGGTLSKFAGDGVMAVWGAPRAREDDAERAVRAALEVVASVAAIGLESGVPDLKARAGVVTGQAVSGFDPEEGLVLGDRVNTAARAQGVAAPATVYVDDVTRSCSSSILYEDTGEHLVKGKSEPLRLWRAVRALGSGGDGEREELELPFVGRDVELRLVKELFHTVIDRGEVRLVSVAGPAGVGKSRLRRELASYVDGLPEDVLWHAGRCLSYGEGISYWALAEIVRARIGVTQEAPPEEIDEALASTLERYVADPAEREFIAPRLAALVGQGQVAAEREDLFAGWRLFLERLAETKPVVLVFEDLQWADPELLDFIEHLLEWSTSHPIFLLTLARPELRDRRPNWAAGHPRSTPLHIDRLSDEQMEIVLAALVSGLPESARDRIISQAAGIPLYALETVRALVDRDVLSRRDGIFTLVGEVGELDVPPSLSSLLASRLDSLEPDERALVKDLAVLGTSFTREAIEALSDIHPERLDPILRALVRKQVLAVRSDPLSPDRGQYAFAQSLLQRVAYDMLSRRELRPRHLAVAQYLRDSVPDNGAQVAELIGSHYLEAYRAGASDPDADELRVEALDALRRSAQRAAEVGAPQVGEQTLLTAMELAAEGSERAELLQAAGEMALRAGRFEAALELLEEVAAIHAQEDRPEEAARVVQHIRRALWGLGRLTPAIDRMREALAVLGQRPLDPDVAALNTGLGRALLFLGGAEEALEHFEAALVTAETLDLPDILCEALIGKGILLNAGGRPQEARALLDVAVKIASHHGAITQSVRAEIAAADVHLTRDLPGAAERAEAAMADSRRLGSRAEESIAASNLMLADLFAGRWDAAESLGKELVGNGNERRPRAGYIHVRLAALYALRGDVPSAREWLAHAADWDTEEDSEVKGLYASAAAVVALAAGELEEALALAAATARNSVEVLGIAHESVRLAWPIAIETAASLGRTEELAASMKLFADQPRGKIPPFLRAQVERAHGFAALARGDAAAARVRFAGAVETLEDLAYPYWAAQARTEEARCLAELGQRDDAAVLATRAASTFEQLGARPALERARALSASGLTADR